MVPVRVVPVLVDVVAVVEGLHVPHSTGQLELTNGTVHKLRSAAAVSHGAPGSLLPLHAPVDVTDVAVVVVFVIAVAVVVVAVIDVVVPVVAVVAVVTVAVVLVAVVAVAVVEVAEVAVAVSVVPVVVIVVVVSSTVETAGASTM